MEEKLELIFKNVNDWLKFAETKNAMLLGFNGVVFFGILKLFIWQSFPDVLSLKIYLVSAMIMLSVSSLGALLSFVPNLKILRPSFDFKKENDNFLYFDVLRCKTANDIINRYRNENEKIEDYHKHLAEQIITNATITKRKYDYFTLALWLSISSFLTPILGAVFFIYNYTKQ
ncbi:Pycsar system effector family protein [Maribacter flavus]|uniref:Pycsar effector protein domain-containing protein n=1 Tax=Maribacter flavus TaxID=1658664 RepID=A0A5B2TQD4_9FLAO|nr:Pycsar system effector family protein [Maribacter flavus]KAA2215750.1 hypothetical protein F0361_16270 [Maribacter flavus]